jgi:hypothetical protein
MLCLPQEGLFLTGDKGFVKYSMLIYFSIPSRLQHVYITQYAYLVNFNMELRAHTDEYCRCLMLHANAPTQHTAEHLLDADLRLRDYRADMEANACRQRTWENVAALTIGMGVGLVIAVYMRKA